MAPNTPPPSGGPAASDRFRTASDAPTDGQSDSWKRIMTSLIERIGEIREYGSYYLSTQVDAVKTKVTWLAIYAVLGVIAAIIGTAALVTVGVLLITGIAGGLGDLFGRLWLGQLVTALLVLTLIGVGAVVGMKVLRGSLKRKLMAKYEQRHQDQRQRYGSDIPGRAQERQEQQAVEGL